MPNQAAILTVGDVYVAGQARDEAGDTLTGILTKMGWTIAVRLAVPDDEDQIATQVIQNIDAGVEVIFTVGGVGLDPRDRAAEALYKVCERWVTGLPELIRFKLFDKNPGIVLYRGLAGIRGKSLVVNLPGSPGAVRDSMDVLKPVLRPLVEQLKGA
jgi:molybdenum cofactor synthesis domain-containing protein